MFFSCSSELFTTCNRFLSKLRVMRSNGSEPNARDPVPQRTSTEGGTLKAVYTSLSVVHFVPGPAQEKSNNIANANSLVARIARITPSSGG